MNNNKAVSNRTCNIIEFNTLPGQKTWRRYSYITIMVSYRNEEEMTHAVQNLGSGFTDREVNQLAARHFENQQVSM